MLHFTLLPPPGSPLTSTSFRMLHFTKATTAPGASELVFPVQVPGGGRVKAAAMSFKSRTAAKRSRYELEMNLGFTDDSDLYQSFLVDPLGRASTVDKLGNKFKELSTRMKKKYPFMSRLPKLELLQPEAATGQKLHWRITLPPYTQLFVDAPSFLKLLGFDEIHLQEHKRQLYNSEFKTCHGIVNDGDEYLELEGAVAVRDANLETEYKEISGLEAVPREVRVEVTFLSGDAWLPLSLDEPASVDRVGATSALSELLQHGLDLLNLHTSYLEVSATSLRQLAVKSREFAEEGSASCVLQLRFSPETARLLHLADLLLSFPSDDKREHLLELTDGPVDDPLEHRYPLALACSSHGEGNDYVQGFGRLSILGYAFSPESFFVVDGVVLQGDASQIRLFLIDCHYETFVTDDDMEYFLTLELTSF